MKTTPAVGDRVTVTPGTTWANKRLNTTHVYVVLHVQDERRDGNDEELVAITIGRENEIDAGCQPTEIVVHSRQIHAAHDLTGRRVRDTSDGVEGVVIHVWPHTELAMVRVSATHTAGVLFEHLERLT